jgi:hypothetical protein
MTTMVFSAMPGRAPISSAAARAAPEEMPTARPSSRAAWRAVRKAVSLAMRMTSSISAVSRISGMNPAPIPWILCAPGGPPDRTALSSGSTAMILRPGFLGF